MSARVSVIRPVHRSEKTEFLSCKVAALILFRTSMQELVRLLRAARRCVRWTTRRAV